MARVAYPPPGYQKEGKSYYTIWRTVFEIDTKYVPIKPIGRGGYGVVCSSINRETDEKVAIKKIKNKFKNPIRSLRILREMKLLRQLKHDNIIELKDVMVPPNRRSFRDVYLVFELMDTDLGRIIDSPQSLSDDHCRCFLFQLLLGLKCLHSANVIHRDLKPENLFVNGDCKLKIGDFGQARSMTQSGRGMSSCIGTLWYRAPEILVSSERYDASVDMWSVGCILAELLGRGPLFPGKDDVDQLEIIVDFLGVKGDDDLHFIDSEDDREYIKSLPQSPGVPFDYIFPNANPLAIDLLEKLLVFDPSKRIDVTEALQHPYMASLYDPLLDPAADAPVDLGFDDDVEGDAIREMMWEEILCYRHHQGGELSCFQSLKIL